LKEHALELLVVAAFAPAVPALVAAWRSADYHAYAALVPAVSIALALWLRPTLARVPLEADARGLALIAASFTLFLAGYLSATPAWVGIAVVGAVAGVVLATRGLGQLRVLAFPIAYLLFMVPLPREFVDPLINQLRLVASELAVLLLRFASLPVMREGNVIVLPAERLFVAEACSGIHSVLALLPASVLFGYFRRSAITRAALVLSVLPIALLWNLIRLVATALAALEFPNNPSVTQGPLHEFAGVITFALGCLSLVSVDAVAQRLGRTPRVAS
jgi:exosortase